MRNYLRNFLSDRRGLGAVEFALIAPLLLLIYLGSADLADGMDTNKKVSRSASSLADLVARQLSVTKNDLDDMFNIGRTLLLPYGRSSPKIRITAIRIDGTKRANNLEPKVDWSYASIANFAALKGTVGNLPTSLVDEGAYFIKVDVELDYKPLNAWISNSIPMSETYYLAPRYTNTIPCTNC
ncbi:TadE/TadG family type IV pilus assembly protein [Brucella anthropi]|uniref:TadE/TadG family type IV pilus assembly protein n=1 Tax=Brucella anthropi TaxID=529 RepID=UPI0023620700|nr:TadE/TadG family type IV pilus assembly protein [Brucella anthropi]